MTSFVMPTRQRLSFEDLPRDLLPVISGFVGLQPPNQDEDLVFEQKKNALRLGLPTELWTNKMFHPAAVVFRHEPQKLSECNVFDNVFFELCRMNSAGEIDSPVFLDAIKTALEKKYRKDAFDFMISYIKSRDDWIGFYNYYQEMTNLFTDERPTEDDIVDRYYTAVLSRTEQDDLQALAIRQVALFSNYDEFVMKRNEIYEFVMGDYLFHMPVSEETYETEDGTVIHSPIHSPSRQYKDDFSRRRGYSQ